MTPHRPHEPCAEILDRITAAQFDRHLAVFEAVRAPEATGMPTAEAMLERCRGEAERRVAPRLNDALEPSSLPVEAEARMRDGIRSRVLDGRVADALRAALVETPAPAALDARIVDRVAQDRPDELERLEELPRRPAPGLLWGRVRAEAERHATQRRVEPRRATRRTRLLRATAVLVLLVAAIGYGRRAFLPEDNPSTRPNVDAAFDVVFIRSDRPLSTMRPDIGLGGE